MQNQVPHILRILLDRNRFVTPSFPFSPSALQYTLSSGILQFPLTPRWRWHPINRFLLEVSEKWSLSCPVHKQGYHNHQRTAALQYEPVSPKGTQEGEEYLWSVICDLPQGRSGCENPGYWLQMAEMHMKGMISVSPNSCIFPFIEKH